MNKELSANTNLSHYRIVSKIGAGGMGEVYLAEDTKLDRKVALKILPSEFAEDKDRMNRFVREAKSASALNHPNIITIYEINEFEGTHFIATEFIDGETLNEYAKSKPLNFKSAVDIAIQIASALDEAHLAGIVHRDIKPDNIMIRANGLVKILDFGIAKLSDSNNQSNPEAITVIQNVTSPGMIIGTPKFMSPEQARGKDIDHQTDIFSFGIVLYGMLAGNLPFTGETAGDTLASVLTKEPQPLREINFETPPELEAIVSKSLQKDKRKRYRTAKDLLNDLTELRQELEIQSRFKSAAPNRENAKTQTIKQQITTETETSPSIAVLPFANLSADAENEYFCDGLAEELLNALAKIDDLKVAARTSAFSFKGKNVNISEIGRVLNVNTVLEGSVRKAGARLRITTQLVNVSDGYHLWSERYDREMQDIFDVQDEITMSVVDALKVKLLGKEKKDVLKRYTNNTKAYELFLKGRYLYANKHTVEAWHEAIEFFEQAIDLEPKYAPAFAGKAFCYTALWYYGFLSPHETVPLWKKNISRALEIDSDLAEARLSLAGILFIHDWNWEEAEREYRRAIELKPNYADARWRYALFLASRNRFAEAVSEGRQALELDPLSLVVQLYIGLVYYIAYRFDDALELARQMLEIAPNFNGVYRLFGEIYMGKALYQEAAEAFQKSLDLGGGQIILSRLGSAYGFLEKREEALAILDKLFEMKEKQYVAALNIARIYIGLGDSDAAFEWLEKAIEERNGEMVFLNVEIRVAKQAASAKKFCDDPRLPDLLHRIGMTQ